MDTKKANDDTNYGRMSKYSNVLYEIIKEVAVSLNNFNEVDLTDIEDFERAITTSGTQGAQSSSSSHCSSTKEASSKEPTVYNKNQYETKPPGTARTIKYKVRPTVVPRNVESNTNDVGNELESLSTVINDLQNELNDETNIDYIERKIVDEMFQQIKTVYETEINMMKDGDNDNDSFNRRIALQELQVIKKRNQLDTWQKQMEKEYNDRRSELEASIKQRKYLLWQLAEHVSRQHKVVYRAMKDLESKAEYLKEKESNFKKELKKAEESLKQKSDSLMNQLSHEVVAIERQIESLKLERELLIQEREKHNKLDEPTTMFDQREYSLIKSEIELLRRHLALRKHRSMSEKAVMTDICDVNTTISVVSEGIVVEDDSVANCSLVVDKLKDLERTRSGQIEYDNLLLELERVQKDNEHLREFITQQQTHIQDLMKNQERLQTELTSAYLMYDREPITKTLKILPSLHTNIAEELVCREEQVNVCELATNDMLADAKKRLRKLEQEAEAVEKSYYDFCKRQARYQHKQQDPNQMDYQAPLQHPATASKTETAIRRSVEDLENAANERDIKFKYYMSSYNRRKENLLDNLDKIKNILKKPKDSGEKGEQPVENYVDKTMSEFRMFYMNKPKEEPKAQSFHKLDLEKVEYVQNSYILNETRSAIEDILKAIGSDNTIDSKTSLEEKFNQNIMETIGNIESFKEKLLSKVSNEQVIAEQKDETKSSDNLNCGITERADIGQSLADYPSEIRSSEAVQSPKSESSSKGDLNNSVKSDESMSKFKPNEYFNSDGDKKSGSNVQLQTEFIEQSTGVIDILEKAVSCHEIDSAMGSNERSLVSEFNSLNEETSKESSHFEMASEIIIKADVTHSNGESSSISKDVASENSFWKICKGTHTQT